MAKEQVASTLQPVWQRTGVVLRALSLVRLVDLWLVVAVVVGAWVRFGRIDDFDNRYYTATVASMLRSPHNLLFASFDPGGAVMVDKPPAAFWIQAIPASMFGVSTWSVNLPQAIAGTLSTLALYFVVSRTFGRIAGVAAALVLAVIPASIVIDSRNEPDSLLSFTLLLAAVCIIRAAGTGGWLWLVVFSMLMGLGFNMKMLVAFVPLPAFVLYYILATNQPLGRLAVRVAAILAIVLVVSFSWVTLAALTPAASRPYVGSTRDNSIWTLVFKYNGLDRFTSFIGPRIRQPPSPPAGGVNIPSPGQQGPGPAYPPFAPPSQPGVQQTAPLAQAPGPMDSGLHGLFANPLAGQLGWFLPLGLLSLMVSLVPLLPEQVFQRPAAFFKVVRESRAASQSVLWIGWLATAVVVFGLANSTTTHPYYLVGVAVPLAAVGGLGFALLWTSFRRWVVYLWLAPVALVGALVYQAYFSRGLVADWAAALVVAAALLSLVILGVALGRKLTDTPLARAGIALGALSLLVIPLVFGLHSGGQIAGPGVGTPRPPSAPRLSPVQERMEAISSFVKRQGDADSLYMVGTVSARDAAPFIIAGDSAVAIGGFSGNDPIFTLGSFLALAEQGKLRYFLMPGPGGPGGPSGRSPQEPIVNHVRRTWQDVSVAAGLPPGTLYRYPG